MLPFTVVLASRLQCSKGNSLKPFAAFFTALVSSAALPLIAPAHATDDFPSRPIRMIVPSAAGGTPDTLLRVLANEASKTLGQPFVIENKPGGSGVLGISEVEKAAPDGYTVAYANNVTLAINKSTFKELPYDPDALTPIGFLFKVPNILAIRADSPIKTYEELIKYLKANPDKLTFASPGQGTSGHLTGELLATKAGVTFMHVPYRGSPQAVTDVLGGQVDLIIDNSPTVLPYIKDGKLRPLVVTSLTRLEQLPNVPTIAESGMPGFESVAWGGLVAPPNTPPQVVERLHRAFMEALETPAVKDRFNNLAVMRMGGKPEDLSDYAKVETEKWRAVVKQAGLDPK